MNRLLGNWAQFQQGFSGSLYSASLRVVPSEKRGGRAMTHQSHPSLLRDPHNKLLEPEKVLRAGAPGSQWDGPEQ